MPSPRPQRIVGLGRVEWLLDARLRSSICAGGGGIPVITRRARPAGRRLVGVEAVIDKDLASALLAADLDADALLIVTDVDAVYVDWGTPRPARDPPRDARRAGGERVRRGLDGPEGRAACMFVELTGGIAAIGSIDDSRRCFAARPARRWH